MKKKDVLVSFSGGRTSAFMCKWMLDNKSDELNLNFVFANTGLEHEKTLEFVDKCDKAWGLELTWIESVTHMEVGWVRLIILSILRPHLAMESPLSH